jgi:hypothetical protein
VAESGGEIRFTAPRQFTLSLKSAEIRKALATILGRPVKITFDAGDGEVPPGPASRDDEEDDVSRRALSHPEVQRFQSMFPDSQIRAVRNLKE